MAPGMLNLNISARQISAARAVLGWDQSKLAAKSGLGVATVRRIESHPPQENLFTAFRFTTLLKVLEVLEKEGIVLFQDSDSKSGIKF